MQDSEVHITFLLTAGSYRNQKSAVRYRTLLCCYDVPSQFAHIRGLYVASDSLSLSSWGIISYSDVVIQGANANSMLVPSGVGRLNGNDVLARVRSWIVENSAHLNQVVASSHGHVLYYPCPGSPCRTTLGYDPRRSANSCGMVLASAQANVVRFLRVHGRPNL